MSNKEQKPKKISRRKFLLRTAVGGTGALVLGTYLFRNPIRRAVADMANTIDMSYVGNTDTPVIWFETTAENNIIFHCPKVEMGQGTFTGLAQIAADELEVSIDQMKVVHAATATGNIDGFSTGGSTSISGLWQPLRELAATMREMIKSEAAKKMGVAVAALSVKEGMITGDGKTMSYAEAVQDVTDWEIPDTPVLKDVKSYTYVGKPVPRIDLKEKVFGAPIFGMDATMPDMLFGAVVRPSSIGAKYMGADTSKAENMPGVIKIVKEKDFVGVVAKSRMEAENAKRAIKVDWNIEKIWETKDIEDMIKVGEGNPIVIQKEGKAKNILEDAEGVIVGEYKSPIGAHAQMEPNGAVAFVEEDKATIMMSTQVINFSRQEVAGRLGFDEEQVNIIPTYLGGGFGRRLHTPNAIQAALLSKAVGKPVKCFFDRKEEFQNDTFRPPTHHILKAKLREDGMIEAIEHNVSSGDVMFGSPLVPKIIHGMIGADVGAWRGGMIQYGGIPNYRAISWRVKLPFATSWWRSLGLLANTFAIESFMDELAVKAGKDPIQFRLDQIQDDERGYRLKEVIKAATSASGWKDGVYNNRAMGFAVSTDANTPCAQVVEVSIEKNRIKVHKVTCVIDPGVAVNPDQIKAQCEGAIIMGMSASLFERMYVEEGQLRPTIYGPYEMALMKDTPKEIDVIILENAEAPGAVGEPPLGPIGAAIANAVYRLTNQRFRALPLTLV
ncbi:xanthine dehydrogenase family protein molybdopterin-binding subunit [Aquimarina sp. 2304DJ70-9]|uniref:xanthine dehydrogenase family protein molybdopterin-binding subunit n=1 Tax=Aquimarina penaris TaxID=3231044 RepID=UPI00346328D3